ncbi:MAG: G protein-coupled receptor LGR4 [Chthoniobacter sp.]|nr:G protein-coupled receptor LGR4 [Chthoniobacter sp.]
MTVSSRIPLALSSLLLAAILSFQPNFAAGADALATVKSQVDLDALVASTSNSQLKQALLAQKAAILSAADQHPHVEAVIRTVESAPGKVEKINVTPEVLKKALGGDSALFDTLKVVDLSVANMGPHDKRTNDPYDAAFFEHLGHIPALESVNIISTKADDDWIASFANLTNLKSLRFTNNGKLTDVGLEHLAGLNQLETFSYVGTGMQGHAFAKFEGWTHLTHASFRGSSIDDEGLKNLCEHFPNMESISLAHAKCTDAGAANLAKLTKLKGLELGMHNGTAGALQSITKLPLEYLQIGEGLEGPQGIALIKGIATLRRVTFTNAKTMTDADLKAIAGMTQLEQLELGSVELPDERLPLLKGFAFLKAMRLVYPPKGYSPETQAKVKELLPKVALKFD